MEQISAKTILSKGPGDNWFGTDFNMNLYRGCCHGCIYCDSRSECYGIADFDSVKAKKNALLLLEQELKNKRKTGVAGMGAMSDPYNPFEKTEFLTRGALELLAQYGFGTAIATKSSLIVRDIDLFQKIKRFAPVLLKITVTTADDELCKVLEPHVCPSTERLEAVASLAAAGIFTGILLMPVLPFINDTEENMLAVVRRAKESGARFIYPAFGMTLRQNQRDYFFQKLDKHFPGLKQQYVRQFGNQYECRSPISRALWDRFVQECEKLGMLYQMRDIVSASRKQYEDGQISLF